MTLNPWTILNTPRLQLTLLDEFVLAAYAIAFIGITFLAVCWWIRRRP